MTSAGKAATYWREVGASSGMARCKQASRLRFRVFQERPVDWVAMRCSFRGKIHLLVHALRTLDQPECVHPTLHIGYRSDESNRPAYTN